MNEKVRNGIEANSVSLQRVCEGYGVARLSVFGSALGKNFTGESDLDLLVEFLPERTPGFGFVRLSRELAGLFGIEVGLHTYRSLSRYFRDDVQRRSQPIFTSEKTATKSRVYPL